ncbi:MAG: DNA translocase FtsK [Brevundimonas mediterranea]|jgi:hypothetical protein
MPTSSPDGYVTAVRLVTTENKPSPSFLQRRMGLGYAEASALIERMERAGIVGPRARNGTREILTPPAPPADGPQAPPRPRTPEDGRAIQTPEDGRPVHTR